MVERLRVALRRDVENNQVFLMLGFAYVSTNPDIAEAINLFRAFTFFSFSHSVACIVEDKVPRVLCLVGVQGLNLFLGVKVLLWMCDSV